MLPETELMKNRSAKIILEMAHNEKRKKILFILLYAGFVAAVAIAGVLWFQSRKIKPNIILITFDALRADHLNCYGYQKETAPFINEFAKDAFLFKRAVAQSGTTLPSLSSVFTSKYPYSDCEVTKAFTVSESYMTLPVFLQSKGYETFAVVGHTYVNRIFGFARGFDRFDDNFNGFRNAEEMTRGAVQLLRERSKKKSFFLWLHYKEPHAPYAPPERYLQMFRREWPLAGDGEWALYSSQGKKRYLSERRIQELIDSYDANIRYADDQLKDLFEYLKQNGLLKNSIIIITADHGESLGEHRIFGHNELYYGILRVPLLMKVPGIRGRVIQYPVASLDLFPTIMELLGYKNSPLLEQLRGKDLLGEHKEPRELFSEYDNRASLIFGDFRLFHKAKEKYELYNISRDENESDNLISSEEKAFSFLKQKMDLHSKVPACPADTDKLLLDQNTKENLESLGYAQH